MTMPANALQAAIYTRLTTYSPLTGAMGGAFIYDHVPQGSSAPYVLIGDHTLIEADTKTGNGWEFAINIHCWDFEKAGRKSINTIMGHIYDALHKAEASITVTGFSLVYIYCEFQQPLQETAEEGAADHYYHGVQRFRALVSET